MAVAEPNARFPTTRWSLVLSAKSDATTRRRALGELFESYWQPLYLYARRRGLDRADAQDAIQGLLTQLLERDIIGALDPSRGRLRHYLKAALRNYLINEHARRTSLKRGGNTPPLVLDFEIAESSLSYVPADPEQAYDRAWAWRLIERCLTRLIAEYRARGRRGPVDLLAQLFGFGAAPSHHEIAAQYGVTVSQVKSFVHRARKRFRELVLAEIADTVPTPPEATDEAAALFELLS